MKQQKTLRYFLLFTLILLLSKSFTQNHTQSQKSAQAGNLDEVNLIFKGAIDFAVYQKTVRSAYNPDIKMIIENREISWQGKYLQTVITMKTMSRDLIKKIYKKDLDALFEYFLKNQNWKVEYINSDHWGESKYRVLYKVSNENKTFSYVFEASDLRNGDWDETIYLLSQAESPSERIECDYDAFYGQVLKFIENPRQKPDSIGNCFIVGIYDTLTLYNLEEKTFQLILSFYCQYGRSSTNNGYSCYELLFMKFKEFLEKSGYSVELKENHTITGWVKILYNAKKDKKSFLFVYESESAGSSGYAKISIIK